MQKNKGESAIIFDLNGTIYDPYAKTLLPGAVELLETLRNKSIPMYLVSRAEESSAHTIEELGLQGFFIDYFFVERKDATLFFEIINRARLHPKDVYVIGDHLHKEIRCGNQCGMRTIWLKMGKFSELEPAIMADIPWRTVNNLKDVSELIK